MKFKEFAKQYNEATSELQRHLLVSAFWDTHKGVQLIIYSLIYIIIFTVLGIGLGLLIKLIRFIAF